MFFQSLRLVKAAEPSAKFFQSLELGREMAPLLESADRQIVLDCENLAYISSSGLRLLLTLRKKVAADGGSLVIRNINDEIRKVFTLTGFFKLFDIRN